MRSALGIVIGLAARAEVTLFDEPYAGLDAVARQLFYDWLLNAGPGPASRWAFLQTLLNGPRPYELLARRADRARAT